MWRRWSGRLKEVVRRHEVLRTTFTMVDGQPVQVIGEAEEFAVCRCWS